MQTPQTDTRLNEEYLRTGKTVRSASCVIIHLKSNAAISPSKGRMYTFQNRISDSKFVQRWLTNKGIKKSV